MDNEEGDDEEMEDGKEGEEEERDNSNDSDEDNGVLELM